MTSDLSDGPGEAVQEEAVLALGLVEVVGHHPQHQLVRDQLPLVYHPLDLSSKR